MSKEAFIQRKNKFLSDGLETIALSLASIADNLLNVSTALSAQNEEELQRGNSATSVQEIINGRVKAIKETGGNASKGKSSQGEKSKLSQAEEGVDKQAPKRKRRNKRDGPAKPQNAFQFFCKKVYPVYKHEYPEEKYHGIVRIMGEQWRKMDDDAKRPYKDEFEEALSKWKSEFSNDQGKNEDQEVVNGEPDDDGIADEKSVSGDTNASDKDYKGSSKNGSDFSDDEKGTPISISQKKNIELSSDSSDDEYEDGSQEDELIATERNISSTNTDAQKRKAFIDNKDTLSKRVKSSNDPVMSENTNKESISPPKGSLTKERKEKKYKDTTQTKPVKHSSTKAKVNNDGKTDRKRSNSVDENVMDVESTTSKMSKKKKKSKHPANGNT
ncbi:22901_t:CDS:2 [Gigaspora margarita]|uniref:22901_t:CDS:1 n=2 Tax=Gigaspora margarita TaxID=4874 RepID=A0ABN7VCW4_GIGMA|nr:high-mobility group non-histone protein [Gigaspora margarita]CAG8757250.1 22901_t:CDS:2 [Gigaspora margarita]